MRGAILRSVALCAFLVGCGDDDATEPLPDAGTDLGAGDLGADAGDLGADAGPDGGTGLVFPPGCVALDMPIGTGTPSATTVDHAVAADRFASDLSAPHPTNAWWQPLVIGAGDLPINAFPYMLQTLDAGLFISDPRITESARVIGTDFVVDWRLGANEPLRGRQVRAYDALSVTMGWAGDTGGMDAPLVRGMPYATMRYAGLTPRLETPNAIQSINGESAATVTGDRFEVDVAGGQTWVVYTSEAVSFRVTPNSLVGVGPLTGWVRVALVPEGTDAAVLDASAGVVPTGGSVVLRGCGDTEQGEIDFAFATEGEGELLTMALPHHAGLLGDDETRPAITHDSVRGEMFGVLGDTWTMTIPLDPGEFDAPRDVAPDRLEDVRSALLDEQGLTNRATDPYFGGKQVAAMGRLALIADALGEDEVAAAIRTRLVTQVGPWLAGTMERLRYDRTWGGIVAEGSERDPGVFFGQGYYNDHHFHYGYHLYAAAALGRADAAWLAANRENVDVLARDIANPSGEDPFFTPFRSLDWYVGHSNASGLFVFRRNQESTSEAVNAWYALALWARVTGRPELNLLGRLMTAQEILAARTYWHIEEGSPIYGDGPFSENRVVGILYDSSAEYTTFFGTNVEFIHGIQYLPFTPVTERLLDPTWMSQAYPVVAEALTRPSPVIAEGWRGFIVMARATFETDEAWDEAQTLTAYDDGNSRANTLWWIATRP
ncbi:MAG: glycosyl hydrolase [Myxococcota bacterium]